MRQRGVLTRPADLDREVRRMFVQVIEGIVADREGFQRQAERWFAEIKPGAIGYLGSTGGISDDGRVVLVARFESAEAAAANSGRSEQGQWWAETEKTLDGAASFTESSDVETFLAGGSDDAGFVQIMKGTGVDRTRVRAMDEAFERHAADFRPDLIGALRVWTGSDSYLEVAYFTSEAEARAGEVKEAPPELAATLAEFEQLLANVEFIDLPRPMLDSAGA
jgi:hypothetical protein